MSDLFEEDAADAIEVVDHFEDVDLDASLGDTHTSTLDARRRLEQRLEEKRLQNELDDFLDY